MAKYACIAYNKVTDKYELWHAGCIVAEDQLRLVVEAWAAAHDYATKVPAR